MRTLDDGAESQHLVYKAIRLMLDGVELFDLWETTLRGAPTAAA
jgi:hypothetical protein